MKRLIMGVLILGYMNCPAQELLNYGDDAPELKVKEWLKNSPESGGIENGKVNVVEFWATWCKPCIANFPHLSELARQYQKDVNIFGISVMERKQTTIEALKKFVREKGEHMDYSVGTDVDDYMATHWLKASGQRGIPYAIIVNRSGKIAWMGIPANMEKPLKQIVEGNWDLEKKAAEFQEMKRLSKIDSEYITQLNPYMGKDYEGALKFIESVLSKESGLKYYPYLGHYQFISLLHTDPEKAVQYAREWWKQSETPNWKSVSDGIIGVDDKKTGLPKSVYLLAIEALEEQLKNYPWSMDFENTYDRIASYYRKIGEEEKAVEIENKKAQ